MHISIAECIAQSAQPEGHSVQVLVFVGVAAIIVLSLFIGVASFHALYIRALMSGVRVSFLDLIGMRLRRVGPRRIVDCLIRAHKSGVQVTVNEIETHTLAEGRPEQVATALMLAREKGMPRSFRSYSIADLAGEDIVALVKQGRNPADILGAPRED